MNYMFIMAILYVKYGPDLVHLDEVLVVASKYLVGRRLYASVCLHTAIHDQPLRNRQSWYDDIVTNTRHCSCFTMIQTFFPSTVGIEDLE